MRATVIHGAGDVRIELSLSDVFPTGHHAATMARVRPGDNVTVIGDGAVGLSAVLAAETTRRRADHPDGSPHRPHRPRAGVRRHRRRRRARRRGRGARPGAHRRRRHPQGPRLRRARRGPGDRAGRGPRRRRGLPRRRPAVRTGPDGRRTVLPQHHPDRRGRPGAYIEELLPDVLEGRVQPGKVFDRTVDLDDVPAGYRAMAEREALKGPRSLPDVPAAPGRLLSVRRP